MNETIRDDEDSAIRDDMSKTIHDKGTIQHVTVIQWASGANNRTTLIYLVNLQTNPVAPRSVFGRGA